MHFLYPKYQKTFFLPNRLVFQVTDPYLKDPKAVALMSGDIDQVFNAFSLENGFLKRKQFLINHPEIIQYINAKLGEERIKMDAEGYKGTSAENGAYIEFFKEHATEIETIAKNPKPNIPEPQASAPIPVSVPQPQVVPEEPKVEAPLPQEPAPQPKEEIKPEDTGLLESKSEEVVEESSSNDTGDLKVSEPVDEETEYAPEQLTPELEETPKEEITNDELRITKEEEADFQPTNTTEEDTKEAISEATQLTSLYQLEELPWWPIEDIKLDVKDAKNAIMQVINGSGLSKRSVLFAITLLENGGIWLFTDDPTVPTSDRDQIVDFDEFKELVESSF